MKGTKEIPLTRGFVAGRNIDFIAITAHGSSGSEQCCFARTSAHLISHAPVPLLVIQDLDREQMSRCLRKRRYDSAPLKRGRSTVDDTP